MKQYLLVTALLLCSNFIIGQENEDQYLLKTDTIWDKEIFSIPTGFAQEMTLEGFEDASFPPGWGKAESPQFWSYIFAWSVSAEKIIPNQVLESNLEIYFDGLMGIPKDTIFAPKQPTTALLIESTRAKNSVTFTGKVRTFDRFRSKEMMTLYVLVEQHFCEIQEKAIIVFRFSPKGFDDDVWQLMRAVPLREDACGVR
jgi:hypothetical protein